MHRRPLGITAALASSLQIALRLSCSSGDRCRHHRCRFRLTFPKRTIEASPDVLATTIDFSPPGPAGAGFLLGGVPARDPQKRHPTRDSDAPAPSFKECVPQ